MKAYKFLLPCSMLLLILAAGSLDTAYSQSGKSASREQQLKELADAEREFAAFTVKGGFRDGFIKYFADDGIGFGPHPERTREKLMKLPPATGPRRLIFNWAPIFGDISMAGDLGYTTGPVLYTDISENPKPPSHGMYFSVWQKQADGTWKVALDMGISTPNAVAPIDSAFIAADSPKHMKQAEKNAGPSSLRELDTSFSDAIAKTGLMKAYNSRLNSQFRIHRNGLMPVADQLQLKNAVISAERFEYIGGKMAASNDLAFTYGKYAESNDASKTGYYVHVWRRDAAGKWRLAADVQNPLPKGLKEGN